MAMLSLVPYKYSDTCSHSGSGRLVSFHLNTFDVTVGVALI